MNPTDERTLAALQTRANQLTGVRGHTLGLWHQAKRKHGEGSMRVICTSCGLGLIIMPRYYHGRVQVPAMKGDALFQDCVMMHEES
jgi:hypothetical protein